jgi:16S rRNA (guanine527-N7)-methyltransferase
MFNLHDILLSHGITLSDAAATQLERFYQRLIEWNEKMNLTGITERDAVYEKHFYDSLSMGFFLPLSNQRLCDVGAGAGFPSFLFNWCSLNCK